MRRIWYSTGRGKKIIKRVTHAEPTGTAEINLRHVFRRLSDGYSGAKRNRISVSYYPTLDYTTVLSDEDIVFRRVHGGNGIPKESRPREYGVAPVGPFNRSPRLARVIAEDRGGRRYVAMRGKKEQKVTSLGDGRKKTPVPRREKKK